MRASPLIATALLIFGCGSGASKPAEHPVEGTGASTPGEAASEPKTSGSSETATAGAELGHDLCVGVPAAAPDMILYAAQSGRFTVLLPRLPSAGVADDKEMDDSVFLSEAGRVYNARHTEMPVATMMLDAREVIDNLRDGAVEGGNGTLDRERFVSCNGSPGREFVVRTKDGHAACRVRMFLIGSHFFMATATGPRGVEDQALASAFLDSFRPMLPK